MRNRTGRQGHLALAQGLMDFWDTPVVRVAQLPNDGDNVEPKFVLGKGETPFEFRSVVFTKVCTASVETATNFQSESQDRLQGGNRTLVMRGGPHGLLTDGAI